MILAVDFDGTVSLGEYPNMGPVNNELVQFLKKRRVKGDKLIPLMIIFPKRLRSMARTAGR